MAYTVTGSTSPITITSMVPGTYNVTMTAQNGFGVSMSSNIVSVTIPQPMTVLNEYDFGQYDVSIYS